MELCLHSCLLPQSGIEIALHAHIKEKRKKGTTGFEPVTSLPAVECSTTELCPQVPVPPHSVIEFTLHAHIKQNEEESG